MTTIMKILLVFFIICAICAVGSLYFWIWTSKWLYGEIFLTSVLTGFITYVILDILDNDDV